MRFLRSMGVVVAIAVLSFVFVPKADANNTHQKTIVTFNHPVEVPGTVLAAGTYIFKVVAGRRDLIQVLNKDESLVYATFFATPQHTDKPYATAFIRLVERPTGSPKAIAAWYYPGLTDGHEFVYTSQPTTQLAAKANY